MDRHSQNLRKSVIYSQNFTVNPLLVANLIKHSSFSKEDVVYEVGPGTGIITAELAKRCKKVVAIEIDKNLAKKLQTKFINVPNIEVHERDFLLYPLTEQKYKVFSNIPFNITVAIVKKLTEAKNLPTDIFLFVQHDAAKKFLGAPNAKETQLSLLLMPIFELSITHQFKRNDFRPIPNVDIVLLRIKKREKPMVEQQNEKLYRDFIVYSFNTWKPTLKEGLKKIFTDHQFLRLAKDFDFSSSAKPTDLNFSQWLGLFNFFNKGVDIGKKSLIKGSEDKLKNQQANLAKIHRTRVAKDWRIVSE
ncbi:rRNA (adenine-N6)-methyltransferase [Candidatus Roizmanbacteria bacterium CG22_combo_CG10-13_8_21_14_all_38_20]|uniref:rRNA (Adenine-N6)-methyltransferase n=1 Tax=Candidatus Roizmanbacteria bacterium CG22_combo_CG10-13_8_21_14_all_38_20 TaxID=1974862 RepID=A0A2H0BTN5_9BACT|nr:23S ribosomal RNA methyltransferase Erm [Candidatus Microgenomates bacterium]PIP61046.1 MAG: rRNA (adenine-N6)-methyltransferase [Candidatus Roizmanbacteria bacterium CG22_combo_CG10-13_8_21_14_all_38_20]PJC30832.1 MAG: 23S ribosomal RNA methyltransferase Erm [Candidatus Roizmanbacteria bacterium CG_4_9_14_0_2_um_filter_38_17]